MDSGVGGYVTVDRGELDHGGTLTQQEGAAFCTAWRSRAASLQAIGQTGSP